MYENTFLRTIFKKSCDLLLFWADSTNSKWYHEVNFERMSKSSPLGQLEAQNSALGDEESRILLEYAVFD